MDTKPITEKIIETQNKIIDILKEENVQLRAMVQEYMEFLVKELENERKAREKAEKELKNIFPL